MTFILWGAWHGFFLSIERLGFNSLLKKTWRPLRHVYLLLAVFLSWVLFRADSMQHAIDYYALLFNLADSQVNVIHFLDSKRILIFIMLAFILSTSLPAQLFDRCKQRMISAESSGLFKQSLSIVHFITMISLLLLSIASLVGSSYNPFIYFRF